MQTGRNLGPARWRGQKLVAALAVMVREALAPHRALAHNASQARAPLRCCATFLAEMNGRAACVCSFVSALCDMHSIALGGHCSRRQLYARRTSLRHGMRRECIVNISLYGFSLRCKPAPRYAPGVHRADRSDRRRRAMLAGMCPPEPSFAHPTHLCSKEHSARPLIPHRASLEPKVGPQDQDRGS